jgi:hypothetical protein
MMVGLALGWVGCHSTDSSSPARFASVVISGNTPGQIRDAAMEVFGDNGYRAASTDPSAMVFEKEGSSMNNFAYGSWLGDSRVWIRVKAGIIMTGERRNLLECTAFLVRDIGSAAEEELPVRGMHRGQYQKLLDQVASRLNRR